jgi:hypothetical protein
MRRDHPSPRTRKNKDGEVRPLKETLSSRYGHELVLYLNDDGVIAEVSYKCTREAIHTKAVEKVIRAQGPNRLVGYRRRLRTFSSSSFPDYSQPDAIRFLLGIEILSIFHKYSHR